MLGVDSAGTSNYHVGEAPDARSSRAALRRGYDLSHLRARAVHASDFDNFDLLLALDAGHERELLQRAPAHLAHKVKLLLPFVGITHTRDVPDPYYGGEAGFEQVLDLLEEACDKLLHRFFDDMEDDHGCVSHGACGCAR